MGAGTKKQSRALAVLWTLTVLAALFVALPFLAVWSLVVAPSVVFEHGDRPLYAVFAVLWPAAAVAGLVGLLLSRSRGRLGLRAIRIRQAFLLAGIAAALPVSGVIAAMNGLREASVTVIITVPFAVLIIQAAIELHRLEARAAAVTEPSDRIFAWLLGLGALSGVAAAAGHLAL